MDMLTLTFLLALISTVATVLGWIYTYRKQKELLDRQISADKTKIKLQYSIPRKLEQLDAIVKWRSEGFAIFRIAQDVILDMNPSAVEDVKRRYTNWGEQFWSEIYPKANLLASSAQEYKYEGSDLDTLLIGEWFFSEQAAHKFFEGDYDDFQTLLVFKSQNGTGASELIEKFNRSLQE